MYQAIYFDHKTYKTYLRDDVDNWSEYDYKPQVYKRVPKYQDGALPVLTGGYAVPYNGKFQKGDINILEQDLNKELALLRDLYYEEDDKLPSWHNYLYLDIEIEMGGKLTIEYIRAAPMPITSIALIDVTTRTKICFIVDSTGEIKEINENGKHIIPCKTERELILKFLDRWEELDPTVVIGYNSEYFDIPYLYFRLCKIIGEDEASRLSPLRKINVQDYNPKVLSVRIGGINHLDYLLLHKKYITKQEPSYKLGDIGEKYVKMGKIEYEGNLNQLFEKDKKEFIDYNLRDVEILQALEEKLKFIELTIMLCHDCCVPYESVYLTTILNEGKILKYLKKEEIISNNKPTTNNPNLKNHLKQDYAGGFLLSPKVGISNWGADFDASSHYPRIIIDLNIGAETLVGWIENNDKYNCWLSLEELKEMDPDKELTIISHTTNKRSDIKVSKLVKYIEENNIIISASGAMFNTSEKSILAKILEDGFDKRQEFKKLMKEAGKKKDWEKYRFYELRSTAMKYFINGCYGALSLPSFRYSDGKYVLSKAVTLTGQRVTQEVIREMNTYMEEDLKS